MQSSRRGGASRGGGGGGGDRSGGGSERKDDTKTAWKAPGGAVDTLSRERLLFCITSMVGHRVTATLRDNKTYEGVLMSCATDSDWGIVLEYARLVSVENGKSGKASSPRDSGGVIETLIIPGKDWHQVVANGVSTREITQGEHMAFAIDGEIAERQKGTGHERELVAWSGGIEEGHASIEDGGLDGSTGEWDQFKTNENKYGVTSTFNEELYTTKLDPNSIPREKREEADRIAREIENGQMASEIEDKVDEDEDEEARYSAVTGTGAYKNKDQWAAVVSGSSAAAPSGKARDPARDALTLPIGKNTDAAGAESALSLPGDGFAREHRAKRGMITTHSPMRSSMISEMKRINALNLEPAVPKLDDKTGNDWINFKASQTRNASRPIQGDGLKHEFQQSLEMIKKRDAQKESSNAGPQQMGQSDGSGQQGSSLQGRQQGQMQSGGESGKMKPFSFNSNAKDFTFNSNAPSFTPTNAGSAGQGPTSMTSQKAAAASAQISTGPQFVFSTNSDMHRRKLDDILDSFFDQSNREDLGGLEPRWGEATGPSYKSVLGEPNPQMTPPPINAGTMPGQWQPQQMGGQMHPGAPLQPGQNPQIMGQPGSYMMANAPGGQPQQIFQPMYQQAPGQTAPQMQRPQNPSNIPQQGPQPMVFGNQQQAMVGQGNQPGMPAQMAMPAGMVQVQPGQNPGQNMMQAVPKFGMQVMMVPAGYAPQQFMPQQGGPGQPGPQQGQPQPGGPQGGPQGQMMQQPMYHTRN